MTEPLDVPFPILKEAVDATGDKIANRLFTEHRPFTQEPLPEIRPAPNNPWGWHDPPYSFHWGAQVTQFLSVHCQRSAVVIAPSTNCVNSFENLQIFVATGWKP